jgi:hypothetical protein
VSRALSREVTPGLQDRVDADQGRGVIEAFDQVQDARADFTARLGLGVRGGAGQVVQIVAFGV